MSGCTTVNGGNTGKLEYVAGLKDDGCPAYQSIDSLFNWCILGQTMLGGVVTDAVGLDNAGCMRHEDMRSVIGRYENQFNGTSPTGTITIADTGATLTNGHTATFDVRVSTVAGNAITVNAGGLYAPAFPALTFSAPLVGNATPGNPLDINFGNLDGQDLCDLSGVIPTGDANQVNEVIGNVGGCMAWVGAGGVVVGNETPITTTNTPTVTLNSAGVNGHTLSASVRLSAQAGNQVQALGDGLFVPLGVAPTACSVGALAAPGIATEIVGRAGGCLVSESLQSVMDRAVCVAPATNTIDGFLVDSNCVHAVAPVDTAPACDEPDLVLGRSALGALRWFTGGTTGGQVKEVSAPTQVLTPGGTGTFDYNQQHISLTLDNPDPCRDLNWVALFRPGRTRFQSDRDGQIWRKWAMISAPGNPTANGVVSAWTGGGIVSGQAENFSFPSDIRPFIGVLGPGQTANFSMHNELEIVRFAGGGSTYIADSGLCQIIVFAFYS